MPSDALRQLAEDYWETMLRRNPTLATFHGDYRYNEKLPDVGANARAAEQADLEAARSRLEPIEQQPLDLEDRITASMLRLSIQAGLDALRLRLDEMAVDQMEGPQVWLPELLNWHPTDTAEHVEQLVARYRAFPTFMAAYLENLNDGIRDGRTAPTIAAERVVAQLAALLETPPEASPLAGEGRVAVPALAGDLPRAVAESVYPALRAFRDFLASDGGYLQRHARREPGIWSVRDGAEIYEVLARQHTTTTLTPDELHH